MNTQQIMGRSLTCIVILIAIAIIVIAGCVDPADNQQSRVTPSGNLANKPPVVTTIITVTAMATTTPPVQETRVTTSAPLTTGTPLPLTGSSDGVIYLDPIGTIYNGQKYRITGITSLPEGTDLVMQLTPDTGTVPTGYDKDSVGPSAESPAWITGGNGTWNRIVIEGSVTNPPNTTDGKWVAVVGDLKGARAMGNFETGRHIGYAYFTMK